MNKFFKKIFYTFTLILILSLVIQLIIFLSLEDKGEFYAQNDWHLLGELNSEILFLGNSATACHVKAAIIDSSFNTKTTILAQNGYSIMFLYHKLKHYLLENNSPLELYVQASLFEFENKKLFEAHRFSMYFFNDYIDMSFLKGYDGYHDWFRYIPILANDLRTIIKVLFNFQIKENDKFLTNNGYYPILNSQYHRGSFDTNKKYYNLHYIDSLYVISNSLDIDLYFFAPPITFHNYEKITNNAIFGNIIKEKNKQYKSNAHYIDFNNRSYSDTSIFYNDNHLNQLGSIKFTKDLINEDSFFKKFR